MTEDNSIVSVSFDLKESIKFRGYKQPDEETFNNMLKAFEDWLWHEIEERWCAIVEHTGFDFELEDE